MKNQDDALHIYGTNSKVKKKKDKKKLMILKENLLKYRQKIDTE